MAFFSDPRVRQLTEKTGSNRLEKLVQRIDSGIYERLRGKGSSPSWQKIQFTKPLEQVVMPKQIADRYVDGKFSCCKPDHGSSSKDTTAYFTEIHPRYPFLDREDFIQQVAGLNSKENTVVSALYHAVLALGSQFVDGGTFQPGFGIAWSLFQVALGAMADIILPKESLENLQVS